MDIVVTVIVFRKSVGFSVTDVKFFYSGFLLTAVRMKRKFRMVYQIISKCIIPIFEEDWTLDIPEMFCILYGNPE